MVSTVEIVGGCVRYKRGNDPPIDLPFDVVCIAAEILREHMLKGLPPRLPRPAPMCPHWSAIATSDGLFCEDCGADL